jgi:hypothetical protein
MVYGNFYVSHILLNTLSSALFFLPFCSTRSNQPYRCVAATKLIVMAAEDSDNSSSRSSTPLSTAMYGMMAYMGMKFPNEGEKKVRE